MGPWGLIAASLFLAVGGWLAARDGFRQPPGWPRALAGSVLAWAWMTMGLQFLGAVGWLNAPAVLGLAAAGLGAGVGLRLLRGAWAGPPSEPGAGWGLSGIVAVAMTLFTAVQLASLSILRPPMIVSDGPIYHLFFAARWWKAGRLSLIASAFGENAATYFPANGDLLFAGLMALFGGDRPARVGQSPFLLVGAIAAYGIARRLGASAASSAVAACLFVTSLPLILFGFEANVDAIFVAGYLAAVAFGLAYALGDGDVGSLVLAGLAGGAAWGTKPTATLFVPPLLLVGCVLIARRRGPGRTAFLHIAALTGATLAPCVFWFARSFLLTGNPLYPMHLEAFGRVVLRGWYPSVAMKRSQFYLPVEDWRVFLSMVMMVFDARLFPLWAVALLGAWMRGLPRSAADRCVWGMSALAVANVATYWFLIPYRTQQRFMLQAVGLAAIPLARLFDRWPPVRWVGVALLALHLTTSQAWPLGGPDPTAPNRYRPAPWEFSPRLPRAAEAAAHLPPPPWLWGAYLNQRGGLEFLATQAMLVIGSLATAAIWARAIRMGTGRWAFGTFAASLVTLAGVTLGTDAVLGGISRRVFPTFEDYQRAWAALESLSPPGGTRVAYAGTNLPYYLMAGGLRNSVEYVNVDAHRDWLMHDYHLSARERGEPLLASTPGPMWEAVHPSYDEHLARQHARGDRLAALWDTPRPGWDRNHPNFDAWLANLRAARIRYLVVAQANAIDGPFNQAEPQGFPIERVWADAHPDAFELVHPRSGVDLRMRIYRLTEK